VHPLEAYLTELRNTHLLGAATDETSGYPALKALLDAAGEGLKPKVRCVMQLANRGAGLPDGGLFTAEQFRRADGAGWPEGQSPGRGAIEAKKVGDDLEGLIASPQVRRYLDEYGLLLLTNFRQFQLLARDGPGGTRRLEGFSLAGSAAEFWQVAAHPSAEAQRQLGDRLLEYLKRAMLHKAPLRTARDLAAFLASYARDARLRLEAQAGLPALSGVRSALEEALGIKFEGERGEHFFRSSLVQTLFYGAFSAWALWHSESPGRQDRFDWRLAPHYLHLPVMQALVQHLAGPTTVKPLGLVEPLDWAGEALNRVDREAFFASFQMEHAVQYFYEPFLEAYDPELRKQLGVWYTPPEVVRYMVARVDTVLRQELDRPDGLADPSVYVLDPCCGTGAYLVETLRTIAATLRQRGEEALLGEELRRAARERVFGFEILPAPFVVSHLQLGLFLQEQGAALSGDMSDRPGVYLTNALSGWEGAEEGEGPVQTSYWPELAQERQAAEHVKRQVPILVVIGNPPYNAFAGVSPKEEQGLVEPYKEGLISKWGIKKFNLDDLYVRFFRLAERRIAEQTGRGVVCYISNFSYLSDPSYVVMRQRFLEEFDVLYFDCLNGDSRETGKLTPDGKPDPSIFSTEHNREGIRVGTAITLMVRKPERQESPSISYRQFWGANKRQQLLDSLETADFDNQYETTHPRREGRYAFRPSTAGPVYWAWPRLTDLCSQPPSNGLMEKRGGALIDVDRGALEQRLRMYYDRNVSWEQLVSLRTGLTEDAARFGALAARAKVTSADGFRASHLRRYWLRPFDTRWCYYSGVRPLWNEPRPALWAQCWQSNAFLVSRPARVAEPEAVPFYYTTLLGDNDALRGHAYYFPLGLIRQLARAQGTLFEDPVPTANLSPAARAYLASLRIADPDADAETAGLIWTHALAIGYSPAYLRENADGIRQDWPRVPLPATREALLASAALGRQVAALLDTEAPVPGVTVGEVRPELRAIANVSRVGGGQLGPEELEVTAGWGHAGQGGVTMPGRGRLAERAYTPEERQAVGETAALLGEGAYDVYLNGVAYWRNVPERVWQYVIGGYQVIKKWLSYRERPILGRGLSADEAREVRDMARRIAALLLLEPALDANYRAVKAGAYGWRA